jgi:hypothetical protein
LSVDDYLADRHALQGGRCAACRDTEVNIVSHAYVDAAEGEHDLRLLCHPCAVKRDLVSQTDDPIVPGRTVHYTRRAETRFTWHGVFRWDGPQESDRTRILAAARSLARRKLLEDSIEGTIAGATVCELLGVEGITSDRTDREAARILLAIAVEMEGWR